MSLEICSIYSGKFAFHSFMKVINTRIVIKKKKEHSSLRVHRLGTVLTEPPPGSSATPWISLSFRVSISLGDQSCKIWHPPPQEQPHFKWFQSFILGRLSERLAGAEEGGWNAQSDHRGTGLKAVWVPESNPVNSPLCLGLASPVFDFDKPTVPPAGQESRDLAWFCLGFPLSVTILVETR